MQNDKPRIEPLMPPQWDDEILDAMSAFPTGMKFVLKGWEENGKPDRGTNVLGSQARYPALAKAFLTFNYHVASNSTLTAREREILILCTGWLLKCEYEYYQHVILGKRAGLTDDEIELIRQGPDAPGLSADDALLVAAAHELVVDADLSDDTWERLSAKYSEQQIMDLVHCVGCYVQGAMFMKAFRIPQEPDTGRLDPEIRERMYAQ